MAAWLITAIERLPPHARRVVVAATAMLLLAGAIMSLTLEGDPDGRARRRTPILSRPSRPAPVRPLPSASPPVSARDLLTARAVAARFVLSYLPLAYGRGSVGSVTAVTPRLRGQLIDQRAQTTPAERRRHPVVLSLTTLGTAAEFVVATAIIDDGGIAGYRLRFTLQEQAGRWLVSSVQEG